MTVLPIGLLHGGTHRFVEFNDSNYLFVNPKYRLKFFSCLSLLYIYNCVMCVFNSVCLYVEVFLLESLLRLVQETEQHAYRLYESHRFFHRRI